MVLVGCRKLISLNPVSPQIEAEWLWNPEEKSCKIKTFQCIIVDSWKRRDMPTYGHHTQNTLGILPADSSSFHVLKVRQKPCTHTPTPCAICTAYSTFVLICHLIYIRTICTDWYNGVGAIPHFQSWRQIQAQSAKNHWIA